MHVTRLRGFHNGRLLRDPYMGSYIKRQISKWEEEELSDEGDGVDISGDPPRRDGPDDANKEAEGPGAVDPRIRPTPKADAVPAGAPRLGERPKKERSKKPMEEKERHMLRHAAGGSQGKDCWIVGLGLPLATRPNPGTYAEALAWSHPRQDIQPSEPWGDDLQVKEDIGPEGAPNKKKKREPETRAKDIAKKKRRRVREPTILERAPEGQDLPALEDIRGNTTQELAEPIDPSRGRECEREGTEGSEGEETSSEEDPSASTCQDPCAGHGKEEEQQIRGFNRLARGVQEEKEERQEEEEEERDRREPESRWGELSDHEFRERLRRCFFEFKLQAQDGSAADPQVEAQAGQCAGYGCWNMRGLSWIKMQR